MEYVVAGRWEMIVRHRLDCRVAGCQLMQGLKRYHIVEW